MLTQGHGAAGIPRITFGIIVLNGEPFTRYLLESLYPYAHQIVVVEGAAPGARAVASEDGHSSDGTLEILKGFAAERDPDSKLTVVTAEDEGHPDGFWPGEKDEQSRSYARRATGEYLWQVDIDEFYLPDHMDTVIAMLDRDPSITGMSFRQMSFWGGLEYVADGWYLMRGGSDFHRLFKWGEGYEYRTHRPPTVIDANGEDLRQGHWLNADATAAMGLRLFHYSLLFPKQVADKAAYYADASWAAHARASRNWAVSTYGRLERPYRVHNVYTYPSWLERYGGPHPPTVTRMMAEVEVDLSLPRPRPHKDIEALLASHRYRTGRAALRRLEPWDRRSRRLLAILQRSPG